MCSVKIHEQHTDSQMGHVSFTPAHPQSEHKEDDEESTTNIPAHNHTLLTYDNGDLATDDKLSVQVGSAQWLLNIVVLYIF